METERKRAKLGEPMEVEVTAPLYSGHQKFMAIYNKTWSDVEVVGMRPVKEGSGVGEEATYICKITPKKKGKLLFWFGAGDGTIEGSHESFTKDYELWLDVE